MIDLDGTEALNQSEMTKVLKAVSRRSKKCRDYLELVFSHEAGVLLLDRIKAIQQESEFISYDMLHDYSNRLFNLLNDIERFSLDSKECFALMLEFYKTDERVFGCSDDDGSLSPIYTEDAVPLMEKAWLEVAHIPSCRQQFLDLLSNDGYGVREVLAKLLEV